MIIEKSSLIGCLNQNQYVNSRDVDLKARIDLANIEQIIVMCRVNDELTGMVIVIVEVTIVMCRVNDELTRMVIVIVELTIVSCRVGDELTRMVVVNVEVTIVMCRVNDELIKMVDVSAEPYHVSIKAMIVTPEMKQAGI